MSDSQFLMMAQLPHRKLFTISTRWLRALLNVLSRVQLSLLCIHHENGLRKYYIGSNTYCGSLCSDSIVSQHCDSSIMLPLQTENTVDRRVRSDVHGGFNNCTVQHIGLTSWLNLDEISRHSIGATRLCFCSMELAQLHEMALMQKIDGDTSTVHVKVYIHNKVKNTGHTAGEMVAFVVFVINKKNFKPFLM